MFQLLSLHILMFYGVKYFMAWISIQQSDCISNHRSFSRKLSQLLFICTNSSGNFRNYTKIYLYNAISWNHSAIQQYCYYRLAVLLLQVSSIRPQYENSSIYEYFPVIQQYRLAVLLLQVSSIRPLQQSSFLQRNFLAP